MWRVYIRPQSLPASPRSPWDILTYIYIYVYQYIHIYNKIQREREKLNIFWSRWLLRQVSHETCQLTALNLQIWRYRNLNVWNPKTSQKQKFSEWKSVLPQMLARSGLVGKKSSWPYLGPSQAIFSMDQKIKKNAKMLPFFFYPVKTNIEITIPVSAPKTPSSRHRIVLEWTLGQHFRNCLWSFI